MSRILITDDEPHVIRVLKKSLERHGYQVDEALDGEVALEKIRQQEPDVLITDIQMPRLTGEALCKQLQEEIPQRKFLIFVLTSRTEVEHREWSRQIDNLQFLEKPVSIRKLITKLNEYFANQ
ncbi:MAG: response regulator [Candidatus Thiodiazotropha sp. (ex Dulcina madagascariensis)]|nr:response regulator [Candidatus Thiodiazotropha sp. (ex Dulcina madagascariensis)]